MSLSKHNLNSSYSKKLVIFAFANIFIGWGSTFLAISYALRGFPPFILSGFRFIIAGVILFGWRYAKGERGSSFTNWKKNAVTGSLVLAGGTGLVAWSEQYVTATEAAIVVATGPFWFIAMDRKNWKNYFSNKSILFGLLIGFAGLILFLKSSMMSTGNVSNTSVKTGAFFGLALSSISWVLGSLYSKNHPASNSTVMNTAQQLIVAGAVSFIIASFRSEWKQFHVDSIPMSALIGLIFLIFIGSIVIYLSYIWLLSIKNPAQVSTHTFINPVVAVFVGWIFTGELIKSSQFLGLGIILVGVILTNAKYKFSIRTKVRFRRIISLWLSCFPIFHKFINSEMLIRRHKYKFHDTV